MRVLIVADDLTGANDTAVQFVSAGFRAATLFDTADRERIATVWSGLDVLAVTSESRNLLPGEARSRVLALAETVVSICQPSIIYKKIDSTLRGNILHEISALREAGLADLPAIAAPAFPANKRSVCGGYLLVDGVPLSRTYAGSDVLAPVKTSRVADFVSKAPEEVGDLPFSAFETGKAAVRASLEDLLRRGFMSVSVDSVSQGDLDTITSVLLDCPRDFLWVGSAGLALSLSGALSAGLGQAGREATGSAAREGGESRPRHLFLMGSMNPMSTAQVEEMERKNIANVVCVDNPLQLSQSSLMLSAPSGATRDTVVSTHRLRTAGPTWELAAKAKSFLARLASESAASGEFTTLILSGGDVAFAALQTLKATGIELVSEILPGVPYGRLLDGPHKGLGIVTKAGGFGGRDGLIAISQWLSQRGF